ncbi:uncharacterized protein M421DRAFT_194909 [Didymella exigua CBS 183.55]|uniref:DNA (cytosine-5)-methyltransferase 1 replication foci domain-containing protein n=1 Tax=Didymella exigua CBS 183.55 TaxID=1150837 RepID=A0A6A5RY62_9PLEO|nr:uncharacterized protein M421DRAFT_194909 [Didymella exigua CBS 183.55]KAF1933341.1 hypothetical protein M421DRAFT_194909 [Didymella exigua CBS 183.55]
MSTSESDVLKPRESTLHEDDWAEFPLSDVSVVYEATKKPASLLAAYANCPLTVKGRLDMPERRHAHHLLKKPHKPTNIVVRNVTRFAYAQLDDGACALWALGEAGWFSVEAPAAHYQSTYDADIQAVELLYFLIDCYSEMPRKKGGGPSASLLYREYAEKEKSACRDPAEAEQIFYKHREFLLMSFLGRTYGISWSNTPIYQTIKRQFPSDFERCKARHEGRYDEIKPERTSRTSRTSPAPVSTAKKVQKGKGNTVVAKTEDAPKKDDNWWESATLFEFMQKAVNQRVVRAGRNSITVERVAQLIIKRYEIEDIQTARNVLLVHAQNLCYMMDHPRRQNTRFFAAEPIYRELTAGHTFSAADQRRAEAVELRPRKDHASLRGEDSESSDTSNDDDAGDGVMTTPKQRMPGRSKKGTLSVLRPKSGKFSGKGTGANRGGKGKTKPPIPVSDSEADSASDGEDAMARDTPTHALSSGPKRKLDTSDEAEEGKRQRAHSSPIPPSPSTSADETPEPGTADPPLPLRYRAGTSHTESTAPARPAILSTPLPTYESNGPRDSWICAFDGCAQRIYGCSKEIGRQLITEHLEDHTKGREKVVGILWREQDKLHLPVNNLIKKIREMGEARTPLFPADMVRTQSIHRRV